MILTIIAVILIALAVWLFIAEHNSGETGVGVMCGILILLFGGLFFILIPTSAIAERSNMEDVQWSEMQGYDELKVYEDVYVFKRGESEVVFPRDRVVVLDPEETSGYQLGTEYRSWGYWWFTDDWAEQELLLYTPSNKG